MNLTVFPNSREAFQNITNHLDLREALYREAQRNSLLINYQCYARYSNPTKYIYARCLDCSTATIKLTYLDSIDGHEYFLRKFINTHTHPILKQQASQNNKFTPKKKPNINKKVTNKGRMMIAPSVQKAGNIDRDKLYTFMMHQRKKVLSLQEIHIELLKNKHKLWTSLNSSESLENPTQNPDFYMFASPEMVDNYRKYGSCCSLLILNGHIAHDNHLWSLIAFSGINYICKLAPFAFAFLKICSQQLYTHRLCAVVKLFLEQSSLRPKVLITPRNPLFSVIFNILAEEQIFMGLHLLDPIQELLSIENKISEKEQVKLFEVALRARSETQFNQKLWLLLKSIDNTKQNRELVDEFQRDAPRMCLALMDCPCFVGLINDYSANRLIQVMIHTIFRQTAASRLQPRGLAVFLKALIKAIPPILKEEQTHVGYELKNYQELLNIEQIGPIRNILKQSVFDVFIQEFGRIINCINLKQVQTNPPRSFELTDTSAQQNYHITAKGFYNEDNWWQGAVWVCDCRHSTKSGLPCCHELKVCLQTGTSILEQIDARWRCKKTYLIDRKPRGRPRSSRRNSLK